MKISTKGRYGLTIMMDLAKRFGQGPVPLKSVAERHGLSEHYLEQLIAPLRNAGLVRSVRGAYGGYKLAKDPEEITAGDIIRVLEAPLTWWNTPKKMILPGGTCGNASGMPLSKNWTAPRWPH